MFTKLKELLKISIENAIKAAKAKDYNLEKLIEDRRVAIDRYHELLKKYNELENNFVRYKTKIQDTEYIGKMEKALANLQQEFKTYRQNRDAKRD